MPRTITFVSAGATYIEATASSSNFNVAWPGSLQGGDVAVLWLSCNTAAGLPTSLTNWTHLGNSSSGGQLLAYWRILAGTESGNQSITRAGSCRADGSITVYRNVDQENPIDVAWAANASTTMPACVTTLPMSQICFGGKAIAPSGVTNIDWSSSSGDIRSEGCGTAGAAVNNTQGTGDQVRTTAGSSTPVITYSGAPLTHHRANFALRAAPFSRGWGLTN